MISPLPPSTVRLLSSGVIINNSVSLVKELVDNGIDAGATSIEVAVSPNTVDKIQVRDNGHGIDIDDFDFLGRRSHTSKLETFVDLETRGGESLGFRGEALACANSLATLKLITRTAKDPVATLIYLKSGEGGVEKKQPVSGSTGTTVQALKLFEKLPVRKQVAIQERGETISGIKRLFEAYALALPHLRLLLKVFGESHPILSYSPGLSIEIRQAAAQIFGNVLAAQCAEATAQLKGENSRAARDSALITLTAFLPEAGGNPGTVRDKGSFISVDSRPILSSRGIGKKLAMIFKKEFAASLGSGHSATSLSNPFMKLNIACRPGSYDPNVSPLKDEVLFKDEQAILNCFQGLCDQVYKSGRKSSDARLEDKTTSTTQPHKSSQLMEPKVNSRADRGPQTKQLNMEPPGQPDEYFHTDDLELLEVLSEVDLETLQMSIGNRPSPYNAETGSQQILGRTQADTEKPDTASSSNMVPAQMRTVTSVNLARKDSNTSDECGITGLVPVHVPPRTASTATSQTTHQLDRKGHATIRRQETIRYFFQPKRDEPIEIAVDETATLGNLHSQDEFNICETTSQHRIGRQPLTELTSSMLNTFREEEDDDEDEEEESTMQGAVTDFSSPEPITPRPRNSQRAVFNTIPTQGEHNATVQTVETPPSERPETGASARRSRSELIVRRQRDQTAPNQPRGVGTFGDLQTPPSSDNLMTGRSSIPRLAGFSRPRDSLGRERRTERRTVRVGSRQTGNVIDDDGLRQTTLQFGDGSPRSRHEVGMHTLINDSSLLAGRNTRRFSRNEPNVSPKNTIYNGTNGFECLEG